MGIRKFGTSDEQRVSVEDEKQGIEKTAKSVWTDEDRRELWDESEH